MLTNEDSTNIPHAKNHRHGFKIGPKKALTARQVWESRFDLQHRGLIRERALFDLAIDSRLHGCDLVRRRVGDVSAGFEVKRRGMIIQQKTGNPVHFEITETTRESLTGWPSAAVSRKTFSFRVGWPGARTLGRGNTGAWCATG